MARNYQRERWRRRPASTPRDCTRSANFGENSRERLQMRQGVLTNKRIIPDDPEALTPPEHKNTAQHEERQPHPNQYNPSQRQEHTSRSERITELLEELISSYNDAPLGLTQDQTMVQTLEEKTTTYTHPRHFLAQVREHTRPPDRPTLDTSHQRRQQLTAGKYGLCPVISRM